MDSRLFMNITKISYVIPCYNEAEVIREFYGRLSAIAQELNPYAFEFIFINDGSFDDTPAILNELSEKDERVKVLHFAKNLGHQIAITAGIDFSSGDVIVTIDADLQDPPELFKQMLEKIREGYDVVHAQRRRRAGETWFKRATAWFFYKLLKKVTDHNLVENSGDYRAFTRPVLKAVQRFREQHRFIRGIFSSIGFKQYVLPYDRDRRFAGKTKYPISKMLQLALNAVLSFSSSPIKLISWLSFSLWFASLLYLAKALIDHYILKNTAKGWTSIIILMTFFTGIIIFCLSILAAYVARIFEQGQGRPIYWLSDARNIDIDEVEADAEEVKLSGNILGVKRRT